MSGAEASSRYHRFSAYLHERFGGPVRKIALDAGFTCPNRDGTISTAGCIFCAPESYAPAAGTSVSVTEQLRAGITRGKKQGVTRFIAYFQAFSNTYGPLEQLRAAYHSVRHFPEIVALAIGTRPDCVTPENMDLIGSYLDRYEVWLELGLQSAHNQTLKKLNRGHTAEDFIRAIEAVRRTPAIKICAHVILGLPGETPDMEATTAQLVARLGLEGVKFHPLHVVKGTVLEQLFDQGGYQPLTVDAYAERVVRFLERIPSTVVVERLTADCPAPWLVAPTWMGDKARVVRTIEELLKKLDTRQGSVYTKTSGPKP
jgi:radical SAM protein (TIGR01212 family)